MSRARHEGLATGHIATKSFSDFVDGWSLIWHGTGDLK
jgi:hypothetical protein